MSNNIFKQVAQSAKQEAIKAAKQMAREPLEILKNAGVNIPVSNESGGQPGMSMMQEVMTGGGSVGELSPSEEQSIHQEAKSRLQQIEAELRQLRMQRERQSQEWAKQQNTLMKGHEGQSGEQPKPSHVEAPGKPKHGPKGPGQSKKGTQETGRQNKG